jgi:nucleoside-diphosphate-sugar epimerase
MQDSLFPKHILIAGASGMVGAHLLDICVQSKEIETIFILSRKPSTDHHKKLKEIIVNDFLNYDKIIPMIKNIDVVFFCVGVYTGAVDRDTFRTITIDYPVELAKAVYTYSPASKFILLSGAGADRTEKSKVMFAKDKGIAENQLFEIYGNQFHSLRPGYIYPVIKRKEPNLSYTFFRLLYPIIKLLGKKFSITSLELAKAMFVIGMNKQEQTVFENDELRGMLGKAP